MGFARGASRKRDRQDSAHPQPGGLQDSDGLPRRRPGCDDVVDNDDFSARPLTAQQHSAHDIALTGGRI